MGKDYVQAVADHVGVSFRPAENDALSHLQDFVQSLPYIHTDREKEIKVKLAIIL